MIEQGSCLLRRSGTSILFFIFSSFPPRVLSSPASRWEVGVGQAVHDLGDNSGKGRPG